MNKYDYISEININFFKVNLLCKPIDDEISEFNYIDNIGIDFFNAFCQPCNTINISNSNKLIYRTCKTENCNEIPYFNKPGELIGIYCKSHANKEMIKVKKCNICVYENCNKRSSFGFEDGKALYCSIHKQENMIDICSKRCKFDGCRRGPAFNVEGEKPIYCSEHKSDDMVNVKTKKCLFDGCKIEPTYGNPGEKPQFCLAHKSSTMINLKSRQCEGSNCTKQPVFNVSGEQFGKFCKTHKKDGMVDVVNDQCIHKDCIKQPSFNFASESRAIYCINHKKENMVDVKHNKCASDGCNMRPSYGEDFGMSPIYCSEHKKKGMVNVVNTKCQYNGCTTQSVFNFYGQTIGIYCAAHKKDDMVDVMNTLCKTPFCGIQAHNKTYKGYCLNCFIHMFPDDPVYKNYKTKEQSVVNFIKEEFPDLDWISDKVIKNGLSLKRPDIFLNCNDYSIIVEIDEDQHKGYQEICENKRIMELSQDLKFKNCVFIRFNPDGYKLKNTKVKSCWTPNKLGILTTSENKKEWNDRLKKLRDEVKYWIKNKPTKPTKLIEVVKLFYDKE